MNGKGAAQTSGRKEEPHPCGPPPPHAQAVGGGESGAQRMRTTPAQVPKPTRRLGGRRPRSRAQPRKDPAPTRERGEGRGGRAAGPGGRSGRGRVTHLVLSVLGTLPGPLRSIQTCSRQRATSPRAEPAKARVREGAGARRRGRGGEEKLTFFMAAAMSS